MSKRWAASALTGGASGAIDAIDGSLLTVGDSAVVIVPGDSVYYYELVSSSAAESSPSIIAPDTNGTGKRWSIVAVYGASGLWGAVAGTLSDQADLQAELDAKLDKSAISATITLYPTNAASDIGGYYKVVSAVTDPSYNTVAVNIPTGAISGADQLLCSLSTAAGLVTGNPGVVPITITGNIRRISGSGTATFHFHLFHRTAAGVETSLGVSLNTSVVSNTIYAQYDAALILNDGTWAKTDRIVFKFYGTRVAGGSDPSYEFQFGGTTPVFIAMPVPVAVISHSVMQDLDYASSGHTGFMPLAQSTNNHVPSGFINHSTSSLSMVENVGAVNDTFSVTITGTNFPVYIDGELTTQNTATVTQVGATSKRYFIYYAASTGVLTISDTAVNLESGNYDGSAVVATVLWDAVTHQGILEEERHHSWRDVHWHHWAHHSIGARYSTAHYSDAFTLSNPGADEYATLSVSPGTLYDEDVVSWMTGAATTFNLFYHHSDGTMRWDKSATVPYKLSAGVPQYDTGTALAGKTNSDTTGYFVSWVYATNGAGANSNSRISVVVGQDTNGTMTLSEAQGLTGPILPVEFVVEWKLLYKIIWRYRASTAIQWVQNQDYRLNGSLPGGITMAITPSAGAVSFASTGGIVATNVQAAVEELDTEKQPISQVVPKGTLTAASPEADRTFNATTGSDYTATIGEGITAILAGFTGSRQSITIKLTVTDTPTMALSGGTWTCWTIQTLTTMAAGTYLIVFKSYDSGVTGLYTVSKQP